jgi:hypothetical protein
MQQPLYNIESESIASEDFLSCRLVIIVDASAICYMIWNAENATLHCFRYFQHGSEEMPQEEVIREIIFEDGYLSKTMKEVFLVYHFPESELVPEVYFDESLNKDYVGLAHGSFNRGVIFSEKVPWWDIYNVYSLPIKIHKLLQYKFPEANVWHGHSLLLKSSKKFSGQEPPQIVKLIFYGERMILSVSKKGQLLLLRSVDYTGVDDVLWNLFNSCQQLSINPKDAHVQVGGFIQNDSPIYEALQKYFATVFFEDTAGSISNLSLLKDYPIHYFSSFLKMASCV